MISLLVWVAAQVAPVAADAVVTYSCDEPSATVTVRGVFDDRHVEGTRSLLLAADGIMSLTADVKGGRRLAVRAWMLPLGATLNLAPRSINGDFSAQGQFVRETTPTGRVRSDGWVEIEALHDTPPSDGVQLAVDVSLSSAVGLEETPPTVLLDGVHVVDLGAAPVRGARCSERDEEQTCGPQLLCFDGACASAAPGPLPGPIREALVARRAFEARAMSGPVTPRRDPDAVADAVLALADDDSVHFWKRLRAAFDQFADGHPFIPTSFAGFAFDGRACLEPGEVEAGILGPEARRLPLVWSVAADEQEVAVGDVVVEIDGVDPHLWVAESTRALLAPVRPEAIAGLVTRRLWAAAVDARATLRLLRCGDDACTDPVFVDVTLRGPSFGPTTCQPLVRYDADIGFRDIDDVRVISVHSYPADPTAFVEVVDAIVSTPLAAGGQPRGFVIDQREGFGGFFASSLPLVALFLDPNDDPLFVSVPRASDDEIDQILAACTGASSCVRRVAVGSHPSRGVFADAPLALIVGNSTSNSEVTTEQLRRRLAPARVFGDGPTSGGFGGVHPLDSLLPGVGGQHQAFDSVIVRSGETATHDDLRSGVGLSPDVEVAPRRSDAIAGRDRALGAALAWLDAELAP